MRPFSEVDHDHGKLVTNFQRDDDLILHSALNRGTSTVSQFFIIILGRWPNSKSHSGKTSRPQNTKISHASKFPFYPCGDGSKVGWWGGLPVIFWITTSLARKPSQKKFISLRPPTGTSQVPLSHLHDHRTGTSPPDFPGLPEPSRSSSSGCLPEPLHRRRHQPDRIIPAEPRNHMLIQQSTAVASAAVSSTPPEPLRRIRRPPHRILLTDTAVHEPDLLHRRRA
jgi:hypothetical protein